MPETFISIANNLKKSVRLHNIDRLSHDTVFRNLHFYMPNVLSKESIVFVLFCFFVVVVFFHAIPVSVLSIFIATAYDIL